MLTVKRENVVYDIPEALLKRYISKGYALVNYAEGQEAALPGESESQKTAYAKKKSNALDEGR